MVWILNRRKLLCDPLTRQPKNFSLASIGSLFRAEPRPRGRRFLARICLLRLNGFAFPTPSHLVIIAVPCSAHAGSTSKGSEKTFPRTNNSVI